MSTPEGTIGEPEGTGEGTGHPAVDQAVALVEAAAGATPAEQIAALSDAHDLLRRTLDTIDVG